MYSTSLDFPEIHHHLSKNRGAETIHEGFLFDQKILRAMAFRKIFNQMDPALVETQGPLRPPTRIKRLLHNHLGQYGR